MPKVNVYLPDDLAAAVRRAGVPVSAICQQALADAVRAAGAAREAIDALRDPAAAPPRLSAAMPRLRRVLERAGPEAQPRQLLLALLDEGDNLAVRILEMLEVDVPALRAAAAGARGTQDGRPVLAAALEGAIGLGHGYLGTEHLLLGLAAEAGDLLGIAPERVRRAIPAAVGAATLGSGEGARLDAIERRLEELERRLRRPPRPRPA
jgi:ATP-dependent Clp protease ATP-binding subunit ClpC